MALFVDRQRAAHQRLSLGEAVRVVKQRRQIVEICRHIDVIQAATLFVDRQRTTIERLGLSEAICGLGAAPRDC